MKKLLYLGSRSQTSFIEGRWLDTETGRFEPAGHPVALSHAGYAAFYEEILYVVSEIDGKAACTSFHINSETGDLQEISRIRFPGSASCHITVWPGGRFLSCSGYSSGDLTVIPSESGHLKAPVARITFSGSGFLNPGRQETPHIHSSWVSPEGKRLFVCDLGMDLVRVYRIDTVNGKIEPELSNVQICTPQGEGPRHLTFSHDGRFLYLLTEMENHCMVYRYDPDSGVSSLIQTVPLLPSGWTGFSKSAAIVPSPDGRFLYCSNRGADTIAVFQTDAETGRLTAVQQAAAHGVYPWFLCVDEASIIIANHDSGDVTVCSRDPGTGRIGKMTWQEKKEMASFAGFLHP